MDAETERQDLLRRELSWRSIFPLQGSINVPPYVLSDLRYRLVQLHEMMHALHYRYRSETLAALQRDLFSDLNSGKLDRGVTVPSPHFFPKGELVPKGFTVVCAGESGTSAIGESPIGELLVRVILVQYDELFAEFFSSAAAGVPYWSTSRDFALDGVKGDRFFNRSHWYAEAPGIFDPHPTQWLKLHVLPQIFLSMMGTAMPTSPIRDQVLRNMQDQFDKVIRDKLSMIEMKIPAKSVDGSKTYDLTMTASPTEDGQARASFMGPPGAPQEVRQVNLSKEASQVLKGLNALIYTMESAEGHIGRFEIPIGFCVPFYRSAFRSFIRLMNKWWETSHPLSPLAVFFTPEHHESIRLVAEELAQGSPVIERPFAHIVSAAAARLCYDMQRGVELSGLQERARESLNSASALVHHLPLFTEPSPDVWGAPNV